MIRPVVETRTRAAQEPAAHYQVVIDRGRVRVTQDRYFVDRRVAKLLPAVQSSGGVHIACVVRPTAKDGTLVACPALDRFLAKHGSPVVEAGTADTSVQFISVTGPQLGEFLRTTTNMRMASASEVALGAKRFSRNDESAMDLQVAAGAAFGALGGAHDGAAIIAALQRLADPLRSPHFFSKRADAAYAIAAFGAQAAVARDELVKTVNMGRRAGKLVEEYRESEVDAFVVKAKKLLADISTPGSEAEKLLERLASHERPVTPGDEFKGLLPAYDAHHFLVHLQTTGRAARDVVRAIDRAVKAGT